MTNTNSNELKDRLKEMTHSYKCEQYGSATIFNADSFDVLKELPDNTIDSAVIDGPYGIGFMGKEWDNFSPKAIARGIKRKGGTRISPSMFAGKYDKTRMGAVRYQHWCYEWAKEVFRVLKPGGHLVSFCSPKRYHRMATAIEDCHFEIRDMICWLSSSNHPFSHDISKAIDKLAGAEREIVGPNPSRKGRRNWDDKPKNLSLPATAQARYWDGWGTRLRQTSEPIVLARKPIAEKSIARNVLSYGTGGINIDACRIGKEGGVKCIVRSKDNKDKRIYGGGISTDVEIVPINKGRYPTNTIISEEVADILGDKAKFFYCPKVSKKERNAGCEHLVAKRQNSKGKGRTYNDRCATCGKKFIGSEQTRCHCSQGVKKTDKSVYKNKNHHPTVKTIALMNYLVKLVTPEKDSICLDLFMGSGTTGISCSTLGIGFIGVERQAEYYEIAKARIQYWSNLKKVA